MRSVKIYVEGISDQLALASLLSFLIEEKRTQGVDISFHEAPPGDKKASVMRKVPRLAVNILQNIPNSIVVAIPDRYPLNKEAPHETPAALFDIIQSEFRAALHQKSLANDARYTDRFKTFCLKYDLEALILAAEDALALVLETDRLPITWRKPVEDQNNDTPPKRVVEALFEQFGKRYNQITHAVLIMGLMNGDYRAIAEACPQQFKPFVDFLGSLEA